MGCGIFIEKKRECGIRTPPPLPDPVKLEIITIPSVTDSKRIETFRLKTNYLDIPITACPEIKIYFFLLDTYNFHHKFRFIFSLNLSEITQNVQLREAKFQNFHGEHAPGSPYSVFAPSLLDPISAGLTLKCFRRTCYYQWAIVSIILRILITQNHLFFFSLAKGAPSVLYRDI